MADAEPAIAAVVGDPVSHSISPVIFAYLSARTGKSLVYKRMAIPADRLKRDFAALSRPGLFVGWNVTIPHKERIARLVAWRSPEVELLGAANVLHFVEGGARAFNTDVQGVLESLKGARIPIRGQAVVILGAGGAALAVGCALGKLGAREVVFVNRSVSRARRAARRLGQAFPKTRFAGLAQAESAPAALYVNTTPLGMQGFPRTSLLPASAARGAWAFDLVYRPEQTVFLEDAHKRGLKTLGGLDMLIWQALRTWEIWFGSLGSKRRLGLLHQGLKRHLRNHLKKA